MFCARITIGQWMTIKRPSHGNNTRPSNVISAVDIVVLKHFRYNINYFVLHLQWIINQKPKELRFWLKSRRFLNSFYFYLEANKRMLCYVLVLSVLISFPSQAQHCCHSFISTVDFWQRCIVLSLLRCGGSSSRLEHGHGHKRYMLC